MSIVDVVQKWLDKPKPIPPDKIQNAQKQFKSFIENAISVGTDNPLTKTPYMAFKETNGKNRSKDIDELIKRNGGNPGDPYCAFGICDIIKALEIKFNWKIDLPRSGHVLTFWTKTKSEYKLTGSEPYSIGCYLKKGTRSGHMVLVLSRLNNDQISTFEFNTSPAAGPEIDRDGEGCYFKTRQAFGYGDFELLGFIDLFGAIKE